jgi:small subunit ribosomal protein S19
MPRSLKKGPYIHYSILEKVAKIKASGKSTVIKTWSRSSTILPEFVGLTFAVHNGRKFPEVLITEDKVGHKLGEFVFTTLFKAHGGKKAKK